VPALLRPGLLSREQIEAALGLPLRAPDTDSPRAPGTLWAHYAPSAKLRLMQARDLRNAVQMLCEGKLPLKLAVYSRSSQSFGPQIDHRVMPATPAAVAHELFAVLREFDARGAQLIWIEQPPDDAEWDAVRDRLVRASAS